MRIENSPETKCFSAAKRIDPNRIRLPKCSDFVVPEKQIAQNNAEFQEKPFVHIDETVRNS